MSSAAVGVHCTFTSDRRLATARRQSSRRTALQVALGFKVPHCAPCLGFASHRASAHMQTIFASIKATDVRNVGALATAPLVRPEPVPQPGKLTTIHLSSPSGW